MADKDSIYKFLWNTLVVVSVAAASFGITYYFIDNKYKGSIADLENQIDELGKKELQARVTQRVSRQLEYIAQQQTVLAERARVKAEKEQKRADVERQHAEIEKGFAQKAQRVAMAAARAAQLAKESAEKQARIARENLLLAREAQAHADTLRYFSLANSLAQSSMSEGDKDLARLLAYSAWYYSEKYQSSVVNLGNVYSALLYSGGTLDSRKYNSTIKGNIRRMQVVGNDFIAVTDYGEVMCIDSVMEYIQTGYYDFRDFVTKGKSDNTVLSVDGKLFTMDITHLHTGAKPSEINFRQRIQLPTDLWYKLIATDDGKMFIAMGSHTVAWIDATTYSLITSKSFDDALQTIGLQENILHIFGLKNNHYLSDTPGQAFVLNLTDLSSFETGTAYYYDSKRAYNVLGTSSGSIYIFDNEGHKLSVLKGHFSPVKEINAWDNLIGTLSNDWNFNFWNISDLSSIVIPVSLKCFSRPLCFSVNKTTGYVCIGEEGGGILRFCSNIHTNAALTKGLLKREFTPEEWKHYVGENTHLKFLEQ